MVEKVRDGLWVDKDKGIEYTCTVRITNATRYDAYVFKTVPFKSFDEDIICTAKLWKDVAVLSCSGVTDGYNRFDEFMNSLEEFYD